MFIKFLKIDAAKMAECLSVAKGCLVSQVCGPLRMAFGADHVSSCANAAVELKRLSRQVSGNVSNMCTSKQSL